ncbi:MAG: YciI family protein [Steroidobacter sp.]
MRLYFYKLILPRPTFNIDASEEERAVMQEHVAFWVNQLKDGKVIAFGPVADPDGPFGIAILKLADEETPAILCAQDPCVLANMGFVTQLYPMPKFFAVGI